MFRIIRKVFIGLLAIIGNASNYTKCMSLNNQECMTQPTLINFHPNEYNQGLRYYQFAVNLDECMGSCNTLNNLLKKVCVPDKTENLNLNVFHMITGINQSRTLTKYVHVNANASLMVESVTRIKSGTTINVCMSKYSKQHRVCEKNYI